jgi:sialidase-1
MPNLPGVFVHRIGDPARSFTQATQSSLRRIATGLIVTFCLGIFPSRGAADESSPFLKEQDRERCLTILRVGLASDEFWPAMHAAEALSLAGHGPEVTRSLEPRLSLETDDQRRCGLARELVRAGNLARTQILLDILGSKNPHGHVHACESLFKVWQIGDGQRLRAALSHSDEPKKVLMAAAALARWGNPEALKRLRQYLQHDDGEVARIAAWILARTGDATDFAALREGTRKFTDPLTVAYFQHALAALGDPIGLAALQRNLEHSDSAIRIYACEFAPDAGARQAKNQLLKLLGDSVLDVRVRAAQALLQLASVPAPAREQEWTRDVFVATDQHPRYSEGSLMALADGRLLYATTEFIGSGSDFASARIVAVESADEGRTWGTPRILQENVGQTNVMSVTLRRLASPARFDAPIGFFYLVKNSPTDLRVFLRISMDESAHFGDPILVTDAPGYHVLNNDRVTVLSSGRLIVPVASTEDVGRINHFICSCFLSDDGGRSWRRSRGSVDYAKRGAMEPEVVELDAGRLLMHIRTQLGHIAVSESADGGETWSAAQSWDVRAPESPATLRRIPSTGHLLLVWNDTYVAGAGHGGKRTPLTAAVSRDDGRTWSFRRDLETDSSHTFAYTSVTFHRGRALLTYYVREEKSGRISSRVKSLPIAWFYQQANTE